MRAGGFRAEAMRVYGTPAGVSIALAPTAPRLDTVRTRAAAALDLTPFEARRVSRNVRKFVTAAEFEKQNPSRVSQVPKNLPGLVIARDTRSSQIPEMNISSYRMQGTSPLDRQGCDVSIFVDGMLFPEGAKTRLGPGGIDTSLLPRDILGIEVDLGFANVPPRYQRTKAGCGTVLIWTKRREPD